MQWFRRIKFKKMDFLRTERINKLSVNEKEFIETIKDKISKEKIKISKPTIKRSWLKLKALLVDRLRDSNVDFTMMLMSMFWSPLTKDFSRLHIKEQTKLHDYLSWLRNFVKNTQSEEKLRENSLKGCLEFKHVKPPKKKRLLNDF